jgi:hypothetical protein
VQRVVTIGAMGQAEASPSSMTESYIPTPSELGESPTSLVPASQAPASQAPSSQTGGYNYSLTSGGSASLTAGAPEAPLLGTPIWTWGQAATYTALAVAAGFVLLRLKQRGYL